MCTMKSFERIISETYSQSSLWNYYSSQDALISSQKIETVDGCKEFIRQFFSVSGKSGLLDGYIDFKDFEDSRIKHIVYTFLLGIHISKSQLFYEQITNEIRKIQKHIKKSEINFPFIWFLVCLTHDMESPFEQNCVKEDFDIIDTHTPPFKYNPVPSSLCKVYRSYFRYRALSGVKDHGIFGGIKAYGKLCEIRKRQEEVQKCCQKQDKISWSKELEKVYSFCSWIVICHNIWSRNLNNVEDLLDCHIYKLLGMESLILNQDNEKMVYFHQHPIFFLFCLVDTIEPAKCVDEDDYDKILFHIDSDYISIKSENNQYLNRIKNINSWLTYGGREIDNGEIKIYITNKISRK